MKEITSGITRNDAIFVNRLIAICAVSAALSSYFWLPTTPLGYVADILIRTYLHFIAGAIAHEAAHGHLGNSKPANLWWGRFSLIPTTVPNVTFRKTHLHHHAATNIPDKDPDEFLNTPQKWQIPFRALAMPHHWVLWLWKKGHFKKQEQIEYGLTYLAYVAIYGAISAFVGIERVLFALFPAAILHSFFLWYFFAIKTHEGYSIGMPASRSHNYYGHAIYWFSFGLSMHRLHHTKPGLAWLQMAGQVPLGSWIQRLALKREVVSC